MIFLGKIVKTRGNKGEVGIAPSPNFDGDSYTLLKGEAVVLTSAKYQKECNVEYFKEISGAPVLKFCGINTINDALTLVGYSLYGTQSGENDGQNTGVVDFIVKDTHGCLWGQVKDIESSGLNQVLEVEGNHGEIIYVPFAESIVTKIDREKGIILIDPPDGLKELNKK